MMKKQAKVGDIVEFYEGRPISKTKHMHLMRVVRFGDILLGE